MKVPLAPTHILMKILITTTAYIRMAATMNTRIATTTTTTTMSTPIVTFTAKKIKISKVGNH